MGHFSLIRLNHMLYQVISDACDTAWDVFGLCTNVALKVLNASDEPDTARAPMMLDQFVLYCKLWEWPKMCFFNIISIKVSKINIHAS